MDWHEGDDCSVLYTKGRIKRGIVLGQSFQGGYIVLFENPNGADEVDPSVPARMMWEPAKLADALEARL